MTQKDVFLSSEGDHYYRRNKEKLAALEAMAKADPILRSLEQAAIRPHSILEVGCSTGWRLEALRQTYHAECAGIDPSPEAIADGATSFPEVSLQVGTADKLPFGDDAFDALIFGFCLYLCDRNDLFKIAYEADRVLRDQGHLILLDFQPPFAYRNPYSHQPGVYAYKMNYAGAFLWNPAYSIVSQVVFAHGNPAGVRSPDELVSVTVLHKNAEQAFPNNPFA